MKPVRRYLVLLFVLGLLVAGWNSLMVQAQESRAIFDGVVSDSSCKAQHKQADAKACIEACVTAGGKYVLVIGEYVHEMEGDTEKFKDFAGEKVRVSALLDGDTLKVSSIGPLEGNT